MKPASNRATAVCAAAVGLALVSLPGLLVQSLRRSREPAVAMHLSSLGRKCKQ